MNSEEKKIFINNEWIQEEKHYDLRSPYSDEIIGKIPIVSSENLERAISSSSEAFEDFSQMPSWKRSQILENAIKILEDTKEEFARVISMENAKPIRAARIEVDRTIQTYKFSAEEAKRLYGETIPMDAAMGAESKFGYTKLESIGVIAAITPFNFPLNLVAHKLGPAIATGNTVILKPASQTPLSALMIADVFKEAGLPPGVLNVVTGRGREIGDVLVNDSRISMITFTGSLEVGLKIREQAKLKKTTLELGSNSPVIVDKVNNISSVVEKCVQGSFAYSGQVCISVQRIYVHKEIFNEFVSQFVKKTESLKVGDPLDEETDVSSLIKNSDVERIMSWLKEAELKGAKVVSGGEVSDFNILTPTVVTNLDNKAKLCQNEAFAPIVVINSYNNDEEVIEFVNDSEYGLQAGVFTENLNRAFNFIDKIKSGGILINDVPTFRVDHIPYGGVKNSGIGKEGVKYSMEEMVERKFVAFDKSLFN